MAPLAAFGTALSTVVFLPTPTPLSTANPDILLSSSVRNANNNYDICDGIHTSAFAIPKLDDYTFAIKNKCSGMTVSATQALYVVPTLPTSSLSAAQETKTAEAKYMWDASKFAVPGPVDVVKSGLTMPAYNVDNKATEGHFPSSLGPVDMTNGGLRGSAELQKDRDMERQLQEYRWTSPGPVDVKKSGLDIGGVEKRGAAQEGRVSEARFGVENDGAGVEDIESDADGDQDDDDEIQMDEEDKAALMMMLKEQNLEDEALD